MMKHITTFIQSPVTLNHLQPIMRVNTTFGEEVKFYVYNKYQVAYGRALGIRYLTTIFCVQIFIPRKRNLHGSDMSNVNIWKGFHTIMHYELSRSEMRSVDQTNQRCSNEREPPNLSQCLVEYLEAKTNCSFQLHWSDKVKTKCNLSRADGIWNTSDSHFPNG